VPLNRPVVRAAVCQVGVGLVIRFHLRRLKSFWADLKNPYRREIRSY
jgi:hypothetical protein